MLRRVALILLLTAAPVQAEDLAVTGYRIDYNTEAGPYVVDVWTVPDNFINTGLAYDPQAHVLYASHLDFSMQGECIEPLRKSDGARVGARVHVNPHTALIQGLTFDRGDSTFWVWGGDVPYENKYVTHFDAQGQVLGTFPMPGYPGSLEFDVARGLIIEKAMNEQWVHFYTLEGELVDEFYAGYGEEGIALDPFDGTYWVVNSDRIHHIRRAGNTYDYLGSYPNPSRYWPPDTLAGYWENGEAEGIVVDPSDHTLWMNADQHVHGGIPNGNRCWHIDPLETWNTFVLMPQGILWRYGRREQVAIGAHGELRVEAGHAEGTYVGAIVDFGEHHPLDDSLAWTGDGEVAIAYRGADAAPTTVPLDNLTVPYFDAGGVNDGWGMTSPGPWQEELPALRFVQVRLTLVNAPSNVGNPPTSTGPILRLASANPARFPVRLRLELPHAAMARLRILDLSGRVVRASGLPVLPAGPREVWWDGRDARGRQVSAGVYYCLLEAADRPGTVVRLVVVR